MDFKKLIIGSLAGGVALYIAGFLIWGIGLDPFFKANSGGATNVMKEIPDMHWLIIGQLLAGLFLTYIFSRWAGITTLLGGLKAGIVIGLLVGAYYDFTNLGISNLMTLPSALVDIIANAVWLGIGGAVVGWVLGRLSK